MSIRKQWNVEMLRQAFPESLGFKVTGDVHDAKIQKDGCSYCFMTKVSSENQQTIVSFLSRHGALVRVPSDSAGRGMRFICEASPGLTKTEADAALLFQAGISRLNALESGEVLEPEPSPAPTAKVCEAKAPEPPRMSPDPAGFLLNVLQAPEADVRVRTKRHGAIRVNGIIYHLERVVDDDPAIVWECRIYPRHTHPMPTDDAIQHTGESMHGAAQQALREFFDSSIAQAAMLNGDAAHAKSALERIIYLALCKAA